MLAEARKPVGGSVPGSGKGPCRAGCPRPSCRRTFRR